MPDVEVKLDQAAIESLTKTPEVAKRVLTTARSIATLARKLAPKRQPRQMYARSIKTLLEVEASGPVAYVSADVDAIKIEFGTEDTPRFRPLGKALEAKRIR
ncbi:hypothetical protein GCM10010466_29310 [Planomonospora alba]|uniref:Uncharacterized protein n=1 Tax=Planomonospora alba TaxID=161354 RepID=A0ABP6N5H6_9ACTN